MVPNLRFKDYKYNWKKTYIGNISKCNPKSEPLKEQFIYIDLESVNKGRLLKSKILSRTNAPSRAQRVLHMNDILFQSVRPYQKNNYLFRIADGNQYVASTGYIQLRTNYNPLFIYQLLNTDRFIASVMLRCTGTSYPAINSNDFSTIPIYICKKEEQTKIANLLSKIDQRIDTQIKIIENLYSQRKCIFLHLNNNYQHNKIKINELGTVNIANNLSKDDLVDDGRKCILYGELFTKYDLYTTHIVSKTNKTYHTITSSGNDLLFPTSTTVNALSLIKPLALCQKDVILGGDMFSIKLNDTYNAIYISCLINYVYKKQLASKTQGTTIVHLYYENIKNEIIEICDYEIQYKIAEYIKFITSKIEIEKELLNKLHLQKTYLLRNLFI